MEQNKLNHLINKFLEHHKITNSSERTIKELYYKLNHFIKYLNKQEIYNINDIDKDIILSYQINESQRLNQYGKLNSVYHRNTTAWAIRKFFSFLRANNFIISNPGKDILYAKEPKRLPTTIISPSEARKIIKAPDTKTIIGYRDRTILELLYSTAIRKNELNNILLNDVDYLEGYLRINKGKGGKDRVVPIGKITCRYLENYIKVIRPELLKDNNNAYLFLTIKGNKFKKLTLWCIIKKYTKLAKIKKNVHPHTFRHSCATSMLKNNADIVAIQKLLGHSSIESTQIYTHLTINDLKKVHAKCHPREKD